MLSVARSCRLYRLAAFVTQSHDFIAEDDGIFSDIRVPVETSWHVSPVLPFPTSNRLDEATSFHLFDCYSIEAYDSSSPLPGSTSAFVTTPHCYKESPIFGSNSIFQSKKVLLKTREENHKRKLTEQSPAKNRQLQNPRKGKEAFF